MLMANSTGGCRKLVWRGHFCIGLGLNKQFVCDVETISPFLFASCGALGEVSLHPPLPNSRLHKFVDSILSTTVLSFFVIFVEFYMCMPAITIKQIKKTRKHYIIELSRPFTVMNVYYVFVI